MTTRTIRAFPDSGHHIAFIPLHCERADEIDGLDALSNLSSDALNWLQDKAVGDDWRAPIGRPWLQGRFGERQYETRDGSDISVLGFWCAIETNLGSPDRCYHRLEDEVFESAAAIGGGESAARAVRNDNQKNGRMGGGYIARSQADLGNKLTLDVSTLFEFSDKIPDLGVDIVWAKEAGSPIPVDLIVDFGNSRTVALALERSLTDQGFASICKPILFPPPGSDVEDLDYDVKDFDQAIPESWFTLMETVFPAPHSRKGAATVEPEPEVKKSRFGRPRAAVPRAPQRKTVLQTPHMFREISPAVFGPSARKVLSETKVEDGGLSFLSSPKRYVWDDTPVGEGGGSTLWTMNQQPWRAEAGEDPALVPLEGEIMRFMPNAKAEWTLDGWPKFKAGSSDAVSDHSRADALVWVALTIIEQASRQIQSENWRRGNQPFLRRRLGDILLTYPSGWTDAEIEAYKEKWAIARDIFALSRMNEPVSAIKDGRLGEVALELDEAVASQLAIVYSEMRHMADYGKNWISLYGAQREEGETVRVMTIDIGGGTTDTSIVEYSDAQPGAGVDLTATLLCKDSTTVAGDRLVSDIVERVLLPTLGERFLNSPEQKETFERLFFARARRAGEKAQWSVIARTVIIPLVHQWLRSFMDGGTLNPKTAEAWTPRDAGAVEDQVARLNELASEAGLPGTLMDYDAPLNFDPEAIRRAIHDWFLHIADTHARYFAAFNCDLVILTGKPSELPEIKELLEMRLPIPPNRIISAKGYYAGNWLPMSTDGRIVDAKLVTALGLAVYRGVKSGLISGWRISDRVHETYQAQNYWGRIAGNIRPFFEGDIIIGPDQEEADARLFSDSFIGRSRFLNHGLPEQVYRLVLTGNEQRLVDVTIKRRSRQGSEYNVSAEALELVSAKDAQTGKVIPLTDIRLQLCTMPRAEEHWQDTGRFEVRWLL